MKPAKNMILMFDGILREKILTEINGNYQLVMDDLRSRTRWNFIVEIIGEL